MKGSCCQILFWLLLTALISIEAQAQLGAVQGRVLDATDSAPMPGVNVVLDREEGNQIGAPTDEAGFFLFSNLLPGRYVLTATFVGYAPFRDSLIVDFGSRIDVSIALEPEETALNELIVEAAHHRGGQRIAGLSTVDPSMLARIPSPGLSPDLAGYLLLLPGVVTTGDRGGQLFVRGGTPTQNLVLVDGMPLFQPFHIVGFYSAFPESIISYADVYTGGFGARYGGRMSSVIDVATRNGDKRRLAGGVSLAPFLGSVQVEAPFVPDRVSILGSIRESVIERVSPELLGTRLPYRFGDRFLKLHAFLNQTSNLSLSALRTFDAGNVANTDESESQISWRNKAYGGRYTYLPQEAAVLAEISFFVSGLESKYEPLNAQTRTAAVESMGGEAKFTYLLGSGEANIGLFARSSRYEYNVGSSGGGQAESVTEGGIYLDTAADLSPGLRIEPGLRLHSFPSRGQFTFEPRLRGIWRPGGRQGRHSFSAAWGIYHQQTVGLYNVRDVTDAFVVWLPSPAYRDVPVATHHIVGWQSHVYPGIMISTEAYLKRLSNMTAAQYGPITELNGDLQAADGYARGIDVTLEVVRASFYGNITYGLAGVTYEPDEAAATAPDLNAISGRYHPPHDRRHQVNALFHVRRGPYAVSMRWQFGSGLPFTQARGFYDFVPISSPDPGFRTLPGNTSVLYAEPYGARLPAYHRLDLSLERRFTYRRVNVVLQLSAINAYDRSNIFDYDLISARRVDQLPFIPSLGLNVEVR